MANRSTYKKAIVLALMGLTGLAAVSCSKLELLDIAVPHSGYSARYDIAYGDKPRQGLDIYLPEQALGSPRPVVVFFYGGSWQQGSKADYRFIGQAFADRGYVTVVADYRLYPEVRFPAFVEDGALAVKYVHDHIAEYGGDPKNLYVTGHSAGAYNAMMLAVDPRWLKAVGGSQRWIRGAIGLAGPYRFLPAKDPKIVAIFQTAPPKEAQPFDSRGGGKDIPPVFLAAGGSDDVVIPATNTEALARRLVEEGADVETHLYPGLDHVVILQALASPFRNKAPVFEDMVKFIERTRK